MSLTYGERQLETAERRVRGRTARRRMLAVFVPTAVTIAWALLDLLDLRQDELARAGVGPIGLVIDHVPPVFWTVAFVLLPFYAAVKTDPLPSGAALSFAAGPVLTPVLFGAGGWHPWQSVLMFMACGLVLSAWLPRRRAR